MRIIPHRWYRPTRLAHGLWGPRVLKTPTWTVNTYLTVQRVNVWCGLLIDRLVGPFICFFFVEDTVTSTIYIDVLEGFAFSEIEDLQPNVIFQQDSAPPRWTLVVQAVLNEKFPGRWNGRDGSTAWPPWSPDIAPLDLFSLWGFVKDVVSNTKVANLQDLCSRITAACALVDANMLSWTSQELVYRLDVLCVTNGAHIEVYWWCEQNCTSFCIIRTKGCRCIVCASKYINNQICPGLFGTPCISCCGGDLKRCC